jgi:hypothetical protein
MAAPIREADIDPTFIQRVQDDTVIRITDMGSWVDDERAQRAWALQLAVGLIRLKIDEGQDREIIESADRFVAYVIDGSVPE